MSNRSGDTSCMNMLLKPRRFNNPVSVEVAAPFSASLVFCDSSAMNASLAKVSLSRSCAFGEEPAGSTVAADLGLAAIRRQHGREARETGMKLAGEDRADHRRLARHRPRDRARFRRRGRGYRLLPPERRRESR
jgi:hypothetical protein